MLFFLLRPGRLHVSNIDGKDLLSQNFKHLEAFGGRGFSVWDASDLTKPVYDSNGTLEEYMEAFDKSVFNTDCVGSSYATYQSPETLRDSVSDNMVKHMCNIMQTLFVIFETYFLIAAIYKQRTL